MDSKVAKKMQNRESLLKYQLIIYNVQRNSYVNKRSIKVIQNITLFPSLNFIKGIISPYGSKGIPRHYHYCSDPNLGPVIVTIRRILCSCHYCTTILYISWDSKTKEAVNHHRYGRVYNFKYSQIIGCHNNWI